MPRPISRPGETTPLLRRRGKRYCSHRRFLLVLVTISAFLVLVYYGWLSLLTRRKVPGHPSPHKDVHYSRKIVAVGDLHSYLPNAVKTLQLAGVVDANGNWTGSIDYLVQTGDMVDRGADTIKLYEWFESLREQAESMGGMVVSHYGNHEFMNFIGDWRYVYQSDLDTFGSIEKRQEAWSSKGWIGQALGGNYSVTTRLPLHPLAGTSPWADFDIRSQGKTPMWNAALSFVHGGLHPSLPFLTPYPSRINEIGHSLLARLDKRVPLPLPHPPAPSTSLPPDTPQEEQLLYSADGPLWFRGWAQAPESEEFCSIAKQVTDQIGVKRLIMGHTPDFEKIVSKCNGQVIIIDTGITPAYGGILSCLKIEYTLEELEALTPLSTIASLFQSSKSKKRWREIETVTAIYVDKTMQLARDERVIEGDF